MASHQRLGGGNAVSQLIGDANHVLRCRRSRQHRELRLAVSLQDVVDDVLLIKRLEDCLTEVRLVVQGGPVTSV